MYLWSEGASFSTFFFLFVSFGGIFYFQGKIGWPQRQYGTAREPQLFIITLMFLFKCSILLTLIFSVRYIFFQYNWGPTRHFYALADEEVSFSEITMYRIFISREIYWKPLWIGQVDWNSSYFFENKEVSGERKTFFSFLGFIWFSYNLYIRINITLVHFKALRLLYSTQNYAAEVQFLLVGPWIF